MSEPLTRATDALAGLDAALAAFPVPQTARFLLARMDALHSSALDGVLTRFADLLAAEMGVSVDDPREVRAVAALALAFDSLESGVARDWRDALKLAHRKIFVGDKRAALLGIEPGQLKRAPNGEADPETADGFFYFTHPKQVETALEQWIEFADTPGDDRPPLLRLVLALWMLHYIHPLQGGNGRVARLLFPVLCRDIGVTGQACAFLGESLNAARSAVVQARRAARISGDFAPWVRLMLTLIADNAERNRDRIDVLGGLHREWAELATKFRADSMVHGLLPWLFQHPLFTVQDAADGIGGTFQSNNTAAAALADIGILVEKSGRRRGRVFAAPAVIDLFGPKRRD